MSESKHTTSPIKVQPYKTNVSRGYEAVTESEGVPDCPVAHFARKADAVFFAAMPEIMKALEQIAAGVGEPDDGEDASYIAQQALAKATGKTESHTD